MLYIRYFSIVNGHNIQKKMKEKGKENYPYGAVESGKLHKQVVRTPNATEPPTKNNFEAFGGGMARERWA